MLLDKMVLDANTFGLPVMLVHSTIANRSIVVCMDMVSIVPVQPQRCHDLAKLSYYISFLFFSFLLPWTYYIGRSVGKCHVTSVTYS